MTTLFIITLYLSGVFGGYYYTKSRLNNKLFKHGEEWNSLDIRYSLIMSLCSWFTPGVIEICIWWVNKPIQKPVKKLIKRI